MTGLLLRWTQWRNAEQVTPAAHARLRPLVGAGLLVAVGYVDPGNWATDLQAGAHYGSALAGVIVVASLLGMLFQNASARLALATGEDLAQAMARHLPRWAARVARGGGELAILATAVAELVGGGIAFGLLFHWPLPLGIVATGAGTLAALALSARHRAMHERLVAGLLAAVTVAFAYLLWRAHPAWASLAHGAVSWPQGDRVPMLVLAIGIVGATVMPHNLFLHAGEVAQRLHYLRRQDTFLAWRLIQADTWVALSLAMVVNLAMLGVAASALHGLGRPVDTLAQAHAALITALGPLAGLVFAVALYAAGQSSAITGALAGQVLTRGFGGTPRTPWLRAVGTRLMGMVVVLLGLGAWPGLSPDHLLVASQSLLGLVLPLALVPLTHLVTHPRMGPHRVGGWHAGGLWGATALLLILDAALLVSVLG